MSGFQATAAIALIRADDENEDAAEFAAYRSALGRCVAKIAIDPELKEDGALVITLTDGFSLIVWDDGRSCCEDRYLTCDDDLSRIVGGKIVKIDVKDGPTAHGDESERGEHEIKFVDVVTTEGTITLATHNDHNGYYGGFWLRLELVAPSGMCTGAELITRDEATYRVIDLFDEGALVLVECIDGDAPRHVPGRRVMMPAEQLRRAA